MQSFISSDIWMNITIYSCEKTVNGVIIKIKDAIDTGSTSLKLILFSKNVYIANPLSHKRFPNIQFKYLFIGLLVLVFPYNTYKD